MLFAVLSTEPVRFTESPRRLSNKLSQTPLAWWPSAGWSVARARVSLQTRRVLQRGERNVPEAPPVAWVWGKAEMTLEPSLSARAVVGWGRSGRHVHGAGTELQVGPCVRVAEAGFRQKQALRADASGGGPGAHR